MPAPALPRVVYIMGYGFSGSTLLGLCLGSHPAMENAGDLAALRQWWSEAERRCTCLAPMRACSFWQSIEARLRAKLGPAVADNPFDAFVPIGAGSFDARLTELPPAQRLTWGRANQALFEALAEQSKRPIVVDSSKNPNRAWALHQSGACDLKVIFLVRRGEGVVNSQIRKRQWLMRPTIGWWLWNRRSLECARRLPPGRIAFLSYERFASEPERELKRLCAFIEVDYDPAMLNFKERVHHNVSGNRMKKDAANVQIRLDERWRSELRLRHRLVFELLAGRMNRRLQRHVAQSDAVPQLSSVDFTDPAQA